MAINYACPESSTGLVTRYNNPESCAKARSILVAPDLTTAKQELSDWMQIMRNDMPASPLTDRGWLTAWRFDRALFGFPDVGLTAQWTIPTVKEWGQR